VVVPLLRSPGAADSSPGTSTVPGTTSPSTAVAQDVIPDVVGRSTAEAIEIARQAGLSWTVRCNEDPEQPEGIVDQEPPAGTDVAPGSAFTMYSARISDCR
jgi:beta-lactam-binding protein with PASTA domain